MEALEEKLLHFDEKQLIQQFEQVGGNWLYLDNRVQYISYDGSHLDSASANRLSFELTRMVNEAAITDNQLLK